MKVITWNILLLLGLISFTTYAEPEYNSKVYQEDVTELQIYEETIQRRSDQTNNLIIAKKNIIDGDLSRASYFLDRIRNPNKRVKIIKLYYQAIIAFILGQFDRVYALLDQDEFNASSAYANMCLLKLTSMLALGKEQVSENEIKVESLRCRQKTYPFAQSDHFWMKTLAKFRTDFNDAKSGKILNDFRFVLTSKDTLKLWLKAGLLLNQEELMINLIPSISPEFYYSSSVRELIGLLYYRLGNNEKAFAFVEDLTSPNAENIKGLIKIDNNQLELALGHFQLAIEQKANSFNALSKGLALTWLLEQWNLGIKLIDKLQGQQLRWEQKIAFKAAFMAQLGQYPQLNRSVNLLESTYKENMPKEVNLLRSFNGAITDDLFQFEDGSHESCHSHDGISCWLLHKFTQDRSFTYSMKRDEPILEDLKVDLNALTSSVVINKLKELPMIYQKDVEELDSNQVELKNFTNTQK